jgi:hypothetical protein
MRFFPIALLAISACSNTWASVRAASDESADDRDEVRLRSRPNVAVARELDQEGVRSFREGRYADAVRYFRAAFRLGGPSSELWNIARSRERLDDPEGAVRAIEEYLAAHDLLPSDRAEADREARALRARNSVLTVTTNPPGAMVILDGRPAPGQTPLSVEVAPGPHTIALRREGYAAETTPLQARFGRAVIVSLDLARAPK